MEAAPPANLSDFILAEVQRQTSEEALRKLVEAKIGDCIKDAVDRAMRSYGNVGKQIEKAVEESMSIGGKLDVPAYGTMVMAVLRAKMDEVLTPLVNEKLATEMQEILKIAPKEVKLSDVVKAMIEGLDRHDRYGTHITMIAEESSSVDGYWHIYLDDDENVRKYECDVQIAVDSEGKIYNLVCNKKDVKTTIVMGPMYGYRRTLFAAYACGSKFIIDDPDCINTGIGDF